MDTKQKVALGLGAAAAITGIILAIKSKKEEAPPEPTIYTCPVCGETFSTYAELVAHMAAAHPEQPPPPPPQVTFELYIENPPEGAYGWSVSTEGFDPGVDHHVNDSWKLTTPESASLTITVDTEEGNILFSETVSGVFEDKGIYFFNCQTLTFRKFTSPVELISAEIPSPVEPAGEFYPAMTLRLVDTGRIRYGVQLKAMIKKTTIGGYARWCRVGFWSPAYLPTGSRSLPLDSPDSIYTIRGDAYKDAEGRWVFGGPSLAIYETIHDHAIPPGSYPVYAVVTYYTVYGRGETGSPSGVLLNEYVGDLVVDGAYYKLSNAKATNAARGQTSYASVDVSNVGTQVGIATVRIGPTVELDGDKRALWPITSHIGLDIVEEVSLAPGETKTVPFSFTVPDNFRTRTNSRFSVEVEIWYFCSIDVRGNLL